MRLRFNQLSASLARRLAPVYLVAGDEPLQAMQAADLVRAAARDQGYDERLVLDADSGFDWAELRGAAGNLSLFARRRILDLRMPAAKPGPPGSKALIDYAHQPPPDTILLAQSGKLDRTALGSAWLKALDHVGVVVQVWPLEPGETKQWVAARAKAKGLRIAEDAVSVLAERAQGNLLAASQEIDKLSLLYAGTSAHERILEIETILADVADSARFNVFELADATLAGDRAQAVRILHGLEAEDAAPALVLWSLSEQARLLSAMSHQIRHGASAEQVMHAHNQKRRSGLKQALARKNAAQWQACLQRCAQADFVLKGQEPGRPWDELLNLTLEMCGQSLFVVADEHVK